jgi:3-methyladenine DNA glycosylase AlkD
VTTGGRESTESLDSELVVTAMLRELAAVAKPERAEHEKAYLKSDLEFLGASVPEIRRVARRFREAHPELSHREVVTVVEALWRRRVHELRMVAVELLELYVDRLTPHDAALLERLLRESRTWALVDGLASSVVGPLVDTYPDAMDPVLRAWAGDSDLWVRRASLLAHLLGLRCGEGDFDRFTTLADVMLDEREFFIRKALGWVLREAGKHRPDQVAAWLEPRIDRASGVTIREAVKYLPEADRARLLAHSRRSGRTGR